METETVGPALTPEEWRTLQVGQKYDRQARIDADGDLLVGAYADYEEHCPDNRHGLAALALHGQPFGFTWEMHDALRFCAARTRAHDGPSGTDSTYAALCDRAAEHIAALLPPRE